MSEQQPERGAVRGNAATVDPSLLDVVPWTYGFAHSWALAALIEDPLTRASILERLAPPGGGRVQLEGPVLREKALTPARADLALRWRDESGGVQDVAIETKVNDPFRIEQMEAYSAARYQPVLFLPGLTGMLLEPTDTTETKEIRLYGRDLLAAIDESEVVLGPVLKGYVCALQVETARMQDALTAARRGDDLGSVRDGQASAEQLTSVAWLAEVFRALPAACEGTQISPGAQVRIEANDRGIFFEDSCGWATEDGTLWVDVICDLRTNDRAVAIKASDRDIEAAWDLAAEQEPPSDGWRRTRRRLGATATVWKRSLNDVTARDAAHEAVVAAQFIARLCR